VRAEPLTEIIRAARPILPLYGIPQPGQGQHGDHCRPGGGPCLPLMERVVAIHLLAASQACEIRGRVDDRPSLALLIESLRRLAAPTLEDRPMDADIEALARQISTAGFPGGC
jgi:hypothetical protein